MENIRESSKERVVNMGKISNQQVRDAAEGMMALLSNYQMGFKTLLKQNPDLSVSEVIALTNGWWQGVMYSAAHCSDEGMGLL